VRLAPGEQRVAFEGLPLGLFEHTVRVAGRGPLSILGVDLAHRHRPRAGEGLRAELEERRRALAGELAELEDADAVQRERATFLERLARRAGSTYARTLASRGVDPADATAFADHLVEQLSAVRARQRELATQRELLHDRLAAVDRQLQEINREQPPDRVAALVSVAVTGDGGEVELDLSYLVGGAGWQSTYDLRLDDDRLVVTWYGLLTQRTGEDWPECELVLSTARPAGTVTVPELDPWYLDRLRPVPPPVPPPRPMVMRAMTAGEVAVPAAAPAQPAVEVTARVEQGVAAATYRPARPVAVPADGGTHRATVAAVDLTAALDHVTAPVRSPEAHLRATVVNSSEHTLLPGRAAVFHGPDFVGTTELEMWAPGEEVELALGVDDRVRVERELVGRSATKAALSATRRRDVEYRTKVSNHTGRPARVTVLDQLPVSRDEGITVRELHVEPAPAERTDLGVLTWRLDLRPGETREIRLGLRVELARGVEVAGWRE
jgi:uncharacterized protein (TIGR02231 family)